MFKAVRATLTFLALAAAVLLTPSPASSIIEPLCDPPAVTCLDVQEAFFVKQKANGNCIYRCIEGRECTRECDGAIVFSNITITKMKVAAAPGACDTSSAGAFQVCYGGIGEPTTEE